MGGDKGMVGGNEMGGGDGMEVGNIMGGDGMEGSDCVKSIAVSSVQ